jgi:hypothetical protein
VWVSLDRRCARARLRNDKCTDQMMMMMITIHQMRHGRQDNHATEHVRCTKYAQGRAKQKAYRGQTKRNLIPLKRVEYNAQSIGKASRQCLWGKRNR